MLATGTHCLAVLLDYPLTLTSQVWTCEGNIMAVSIPIVLTLKKSCRAPEVRAQIQEVIAGFGLELTGTGAGTLSCRVTPSRFADLFGRQANALAARPPTETDYGTPGGYEDEDLPIPPELVTYLDSITILPPATRLRQPAR